MSRWRIFISCSFTRPLVIWINTSQMYSSSNYPPFFLCSNIFCNKSPPSAYYMTILKIGLKSTTKTWTWGHKKLPYTRWYWGVWWRQVFWPHWRRYVFPWSTSWVTWLSSAHKWFSRWAVWLCRLRSRRLSRVYRWFRSLGGTFFGLYIVLVGLR